MHQPTAALFLFAGLIACAAPDRQRDDNAAAGAPGLGAADSGAALEGAARDSVRPDTMARRDEPTRDSARAVGTTAQSADRRSVRRGRAGTPSDTIASHPETSQMSDTLREPREPKPSDFRLPERRLPPPELDRPLGVPPDSEPERDTTRPPPGAAAPEADTGS